MKQSIEYFSIAFLHRLEQFLFDFQNLLLVKCCWIHRVIFYTISKRLAANGPSYGKCGVLKPNLCPKDRTLYSSKVLIFKQSARISTAELSLHLFFFVLVLLQS